MNHQHRKTLAGIFAHPLPHNLDPRAVVHVLESLGAEITHSGHGATKVSLNGQHGSFHFDAHDVAAEEVVNLRHLLTAAGVAPAGDPG